MEFKLVVTETRVYEAVHSVEAPTLMEAVIMVLNIDLNIPTKMTFRKVLSRDAHGVDEPTPCPRSRRQNARLEA